MPKTVILNAMLGQGHLSPLVGIATQLMARDDYEVQFLVNAVDRDAVVKQFASMAPAAAAARFAAEGAVAYDDPTRFEAIFSDMVEKGCMHLVGFNDARQAAVDAAVDDVLKTRDAGDVVGVVDFMSLAAGRALFKRGIPYYVTFPGPAGMLGVFGCADMPLPLELVAPYVATRVVPSARRMMGEFFACVTQNADNAAGIFTSSIEAPDLCACGGPSGSPRLHYVHTFSPPSDATCGPFVEAHPAAAALLDSPKPLVLVGGSSIPTQSLTAFGLSEILKALRRGKDEWNVVLKVCHRETFEEALERASFDVEAERGWFVAAAFIPQAPLLDRAACFVTHMGWNGTCEALQRGVPMLCTPVAVDQPINAAHCASLGVALVLDTADPSSSGPTPGKDNHLRDPERVAEADVYAKLTALVAADSPYRARATAVKDEHFPEGATDIGPAAVVAELDRLFQVKKMTREYEVELAQHRASLAAAGGAQEAKVGEVAAAA